MVRIAGWIAALGLACGTWASAQQPLPYGPPPSPYGGQGGYGYPGYPMPAYDPQRPFIPHPGYAQPMVPYLQGMPTTMPGNPYGSVPKMPPAEPYRVPTGPELPVDPQPDKNATHPLMLPDKVPSTPTGKAKTPPTPTEPTTSGGVGESFIRLVQAMVPDNPSEPFTTYEGLRYGAEVRLENGNTWIQGSFLHYWTRRDTAPPLATTGDPASPNTGALGNPDTALLLGGSTAPREFSGAQLTLGTWLDRERIKFIEVGGFWLAPRSRTFSLFPDAAGNPPIIQPLRFPDEGGIPISFPGDFSGTLNVRTDMELHGLELNFGRNIYRLNCWSFDFLYGARYLYLNDALAMDQNITVLAGGAGAFPFNGVGQPAGANILISDSFKTTTRFYGGQIGARINRAWRRFDFGATAKVAFGVNADVVIIDGASTLNAGGASTTFPGGVLAQSSNIGRYSNTRFSVVPELNASAGFQLTRAIRVFAGYNLLYWTRIERASGQIDRQINLAAQFPTSPGFGGGIAPTNPAYLANPTNFWAQGINLGLEYKY
ncbi:MAG: BBP7 family outer membrane beta-barrel protein [Planctomycetes bacterium]|nr:BBP7 family outer membrane beta-barrel protein [Planctomycetota bacterium]